jgi:SAM-dependent methyltransferase
VVGVDIAAPYIAFARAHAAATNLAFEIADAAKLPFGDKSFAAAAAQLALNFVPDPLAVLNEMRRVTAPGGHLVAAVWDFRGGLVYQRIFWDTAAGLDAGAAAARDRLFSGALALPDGLVELFKSAGLDPIERTSITIRMGGGCCWRISCNNYDPPPQPSPNISAFTRVFDALWGEGAHRKRVALLITSQRNCASISASRGQGRRAGGSPR